MPALLEEVAEPLGTAIDNLARAEKLGWLDSVDHWLAARKLRNRMIDEYVRDAEVLAATLSAGHAAVPLLLAAAAAFTAEAKRRLPV